MDDHGSRRHQRIDAAALDWVEVSADGQVLCLRLRDHAGRPASVSLPVAGLNALLSAVPRRAADLLRPGGPEVHAIDGWTLTQDRDRLALTLHLPDSARISFAVKPSQLAAMASLVGPVGLGAPARLN